MSLEASGALAGTIVYSRWKGRPYVRQLVTPSNPKSALQTSTRAILRFLSQQWATGLSAGQKATWIALAKATNVSPFNAFVQANLKNWTQTLAPSKATPILRVATSATFTALPASTGGVRQISIAWTTLLINAGWGILIYLGTPGGGPVTTGRPTLRLTTPQAAGAGSAIITPVPAGVYHLNYRSFTDDGKQSADLGDTTATVT
jgi:uncharacterized Zn-binding protein involved in type VI secretion